MSVVRVYVQSGTRLAVIEEASALAAAKVGHMRSLGLFVASSLQHLYDAEQLTLGPVSDYFVTELVKENRELLGQAVRAVVAA